MRRIIFALALALTLFVPVVSAHPAAPSRPLGTQCDTTHWNTYYGGTHRYSSPGQYDFSVQSMMYVLVSNTTGQFCGQMYSGATDTLYAGCINFSGAAGENGWTVQGSNWGYIYHCTATTYVFYGPVWNITCNAGSVLYTSTTGDYDIGQIDHFQATAYYGPWSC